MTAPHPGLPEASPDVAGELALEQEHVDRVYAELEKASRRAADVEADGMARGRTSRTGDVRDEEMTGLFERDALVYAAARRRSMIEKQYEGLVFGRLDLGAEGSTAADREVRYIGRLGVRDDEYLHATNLVAGAGERRGRPGIRAGVLGPGGTGAGTGLDW